MLNIYSERHKYMLEDSYKKIKRMDRIWYMFRRGSKIE